jgi:hypothetical protein
MLSSLISRTSAVLLLLGGATLLFASDAVLPRLLSGFPTSGAWLGQLLAAAWLGIGALNWLGRSALLGGIYGRPVVMANFALYFITTMVLVRRVMSGAVPGGLWLVLVPVALFAIAYGGLLFRGPLERDFKIQRGAG